MKQERITEIAERNVSTLSSVNKGAIVEMCENAITEALKEASKISSNGMLAVTSDSKENNKQSEVAVAFADWIRENKKIILVEEYRKWNKYGDGKQKIFIYEYTTQELYELFEQEKAKATDR